MTEQSTSARVLHRVCDSDGDDIVAQLAVADAAFRVSRADLSRFATTPVVKLEVDEIDEPN